MNSVEVELTISVLAYGGEGIGRLPDGRAVFVPFVLPGERVRARIVEEKRGFARAELLEVLQPAAGRISPRCAHFGVCGGCHYQHMDYKSQLSAKEAILRDQLERIGKLSDPPLRPAVASPQPWNYRNHIQFHLDPDGRLGYIRADTQRASAGGDGVMPVRECHLPEEPLDQLWPQLEFEPLTAIERVSLRLGADGVIQIVLESEDPETPELDIEAGVSVVHLFADNPLVLAGQDSLWINVSGREFRVSAGAFFQVNTAMAGKMVAHLLERLPVSPDTTLVDVYCGAGLFSAFFAPRVGRLVGIESSPAACDDFADNLDEFENVELYQAPAEDVLPHLDLRPQVVLVDPPRAGLGRAVVDAILEMGPATLAYVSCDPSTLARDAARLVKGGYWLVEVTPFDLFPHTFHIESISIFER